jgi:hypothetical protein
MSCAWPAGNPPKGWPRPPQRPPNPRWTRRYARWPRRRCRTCWPCSRKEIAEGHGKASAGAAGALRNALKEHGRWLTTSWTARPMRPWLPPANSKAGSAGAPTSCARSWWPRPRGCLSAAKASRPSPALVGARCRKPCASCASSGSRPTREGSPTTPVEAL